MKLIPLVALAVCQIALANTYPNSTSGSNLLVQSEVIRQRMAPFYGEIPTNKIEVKNIGSSIEQYSAKEIFQKASDVSKSIPGYAGNVTVENVPSRSIISTPQFFSNQSNNSQKIAESLIINKKSVILSTKNIETITTLSAPDVFSINMEFNWKKPYGQFMNQLLKDIQTAKQEGNTEKYKKLTAQYQVWADEYLIKGTPTRVMK